MSTAPVSTSGLVSSVHAWGLEDATEQLAPLVDVRYVQLERGVARFDGIVAKADKIIAGRCHGSCNKLERYDVPASRSLVLMSPRGLARVGPTNLESNRVAVVRGPAELVIFTDRECHLLFALLPAIGLVAGIQVLQLSAEQLHAFAQNIETALSDANAAATSLATLPGMCASWLMRDRAPTRTQSMVTARRSAAVRAREYIDRNLDRSLTLASVCRASYSSPRALEYGFREVFGVSPIAYVRLSRLSCVRRELYEAAPIHGIVTQLAMKWGFWHLSQFAKDYQELFGELPSATLNRASSRLPAVRPRAQIR